MSLNPPNTSPPPLSPWRGNGVGRGVRGSRGGGRLNGGYFAEFSEGMIFVAERFDAAYVLPTFVGFAAGSFCDNPDSSRNALSWMAMCQALPFSA